MKKSSVEKTRLVGKNRLVGNKFARARTGSPANRDTEPTLSFVRPNSYFSDRQDPLCLSFLAFLLGLLLVGCGELICAPVASRLLDVLPPDGLGEVCGFYVMHNV